MMYVYWLVLILAAGKGTETISILLKYMSVTKYASSLVQFQFYIFSNQKVKDAIRIIENG